MKRMHIHIGVDNLDESVRFYSTLFGTAPIKTKSDYAKWLLDDLRVNFAISPHRGSQWTSQGGRHMASQNELNEAMVLDLLRLERSMKLEHLVSLLPQLSWNQVFHCVDRLSRRGDIILLRRGFDYKLPGLPSSDRPHHTRRDLLLSRLVFSGVRAARYEPGADIARLCR